MIPFFMNLHIVEDGRTKIRLPLPLFLVWILLLCLFLILLPFLLLAAIIFWILRNNLRILAFIPKLFSIICALSGLRIQIEEKNKKIFLTIQ